MPFWGDGGRGDQGHPGARRDRHGQALRGERSRVRTVPDQRRGGRARTARALSAAVRDVGQGRRNRGDHELLQPGARRLRHRISVHPDRHPAYRVGFRWLRPVRLLVLPLLCPLAQRRHGPRDAGRQVAQRDECQGSPFRHKPGDRDRRPGPGPPLYPDVPVRTVRARLRSGRDRRAGPRRCRPNHRLADRRPTQERRQAAAARRQRRVHRDHRPVRVRRRGLPRAAAAHPR